MTQDDRMPEEKDHHGHGHHDKKDILEGKDDRRFHGLKILLGGHARERRQDRRGQ